MPIRPRSVAAALLAALTALAAKDWLRGTRRAEAPGVGHAETAARELLAERWLAAHGFVALVDQEDAYSIPDFPAPSEPKYGQPVLFGPRGVAAHTGPDAEVDVRVVAGPAAPGGDLRGQGGITVGGGGLLLTDGPVMTAVPWPAGPVRVRVYGRSSLLGRLWGSVIGAPGLGTTHLTFVLERDPV